MELYTIPIPISSLKKILFFLFFLVLIGISFFLGTKYEWKKENNAATIKTVITRTPTPSLTPTLPKQQEIISPEFVLQETSETASWQRISYKSLSLKIPTTWDTLLSRSHNNEGDHESLILRDPNAIARPRTETPTPYDILVEENTTAEQAKKRFLENWKSFHPIIIQETVLIVKDKKIDLVTFKNNDTYAEIRQFAYIQDKNNTYVITSGPLLGEKTANPLFFLELLSTVSLQK